MSKDEVNCMESDSSFIAYILSCHKSQFAQFYGVKVDMFQRKIHIDRNQRLSAALKQCESTAIGSGRNRKIKATG